MINLFRKKISGAATLIVTIVLLTVSTLVIIFAANQGQFLEKMTANQSRNSQAFQAALAGLEYGINYLQTNSATILASPVSGYIPAYSDSNTSQTLANNSSFTIVYSNPIANNYNIIKITSTGRSDDNSATRVVSQLVAFGSLLSNPGTTALTALDNITLSGNATVTNTSSNQTIQTAGTVTISGSGQTITSGGTSSTAGNIKSDVQQNSSSLQGLSQNNFFATYFGTADTNTIKNKVGFYYSNNSNTNYSSTLNGKTGTSIWIDQNSSTTATINGTTTIGSSANPVLLIVNGRLSLSGNITIYGFVYVIGSTGIDAITGNVQIIGGMATTNDLNMSGNINLTYNPTTLSNLQNNSTMRYYAKIPGSWKDF